MDLNKLTYLLITGASKGIGKELAIQCSKKLKPNSIVVLLARSKEDLEKTKDIILNVTNHIKIITYSIDLSKATADDFKSIINDSLVDVNIEIFELCWIIHNAGSVGDVSQRAENLIDANIWNKYFDLNLFSVTALNGIFLKIFSKIDDHKKLIVNITSKAGIIPFKSFTLYCCGKASREMYFRVLAEEHPNLKILNYSPGPCDTKMADEVQLRTYDEGVRDAFKNRRETKEILTTLQTTEKFLKILENYKFKSADHVDYFDPI